MSRSVKGKKSVGFEWDRKAEGKAGYTTPGDMARKEAHRAQRAIGKKEAMAGSCGKLTPHGTACTMETGHEDDCL
jgi:hypothetical protein